MKQPIEHLATLRHRQDENVSVWVYSLAFDPDGQVLACAGFDHAITLWSSADGTELRRLKAKREVGIPCVLFSSDGSLLAHGNSDNTISLRDAQSGDEVRSLGVPASEYSVPLRAGAFSPDGSLLASGGDDGAIRLWAVATGEWRGSLQGHSSWVCTLAFSPDGHILASGSKDKTITLWDRSTRRPIRVVSGHRDMVSSVAFSPTGYTLASGSGSWHFEEQDNSVILWDVKTGNWLRRLEMAAPVSSVAFSADGQTLAVGLVANDGRAEVWSVREGQKLCELPGHARSVFSVAFSRNGRYLATGSEDGTARLWGVTITEAEWRREQEARRARAKEESERRRQMWRATHRCEVCGAPLGPLDRIAGRTRCSAHR